MKKKLSKHISDYLTKHTGDEAKIAAFGDFIDGFFAGMDEEYSDVVHAFEEEVEDFTEEVTTEMIAAIIENLKHRDGTLSGMKWSMDETSGLVSQYDIKNKMEQCGKHYCAEKFWFAMNYVYAVHYSLSRTLNAYVELAIDELCNKNICIDDMIKRIFEKI